MKHKQIMVGAATVAVAAFCFWSVLRLWHALRDAASAEIKRNDARGQLDGIYRQNPFPSVANRNRAAEDRAQLKNWVSKLGTMLVDSNPATSMSPPLFMQNLQRDMQNLAALPSGSGSRLAPEGFAFGFERYGSADGRMPEPEDIRRLSLQLKIIGHLCRELSDAGIPALIAVRRELFESGTGKGAEMAPVKPKYGSKKQRPAAAAVATPVVQGASRQHFSLEFLARKNTAFDVLNRLAAMELFVVVTDLAIRKTADDLKIAPASPAELGTRKGQGEAADSIDRVAAGPLVDPPLNVRLELDVYVFDGV